MKYSELVLSLIGVLPGMLLSDHAYKNKRLKRILKYAKKSLLSEPPANFR